jgi:hypothetical protein
MIDSCSFEQNHLSHMCAMIRPTGDHAMAWQVG